MREKDVGVNERSKVMIAMEWKWNTNTARFNSMISSGYSVDPQENKLELQSET